MTTPAGGKHFAPSPAAQQPASGAPRRADQSPAGTRFRPQPAAPPADTPRATADHASVRVYSRKRARSYSKRAHSLGHRFFLGPGVTALAAGAVVFAGISGISGAVRMATEPSIASTATVRQRDVPTLREVSYTTVSFSAVGDNLMNLPVVEAADANAGEMYDGLYDFTPMYQGVADIVATHDLNFIDIETILGGDHLGLTGYPSFNSPAAIADEVADFGWNLATTATNHSLDVGIEGINNSSATWAAHPEVVVTGTFVSPEDRARIRTVEKNGITFAFLSYTDYLNGIPVPSGYEYAVATADTDAMVADVTRAHELADVVIVAMSWGSENDFVPNETQRYFAQLLANLGVDLVVGFGPHVDPAHRVVPAARRRGQPHRVADSRGVLARQLPEQPALRLRQCRGVLYLRVRAAGPARAHHAHRPGLDAAHQPHRRRLPRGLQAARLHPRARLGPRQPLERGGRPPRVRLGAYQRRNRAERGGDPVGKEGRAAWVHRCPRHTLSVTACTTVYNGAQSCATVYNRPGGSHTQPR